MSTSTRYFVKEYKKTCDQCLWKKKKLRHKLNRL